MKNALTYKNLGSSVKDVDTKNRVITGYLAAFGNKDYHNDIIMPGAFKKSLAENRDAIFFLNQHDWSQPHGKFDVLREDGKGLYFESKPLVKGVTYSDDALKLYEAGIMNEHSIGFQTILYEDIEDEDGGYTKLKELKLYEGSNVTRAANPQTPFTGFKSLTIEQINGKIDKIIAYMKSGNISDDGFRLLELSLKELQLHSIELGKSLNNQEPFFDDTFGNIEPINIIDKFIKTI